MNQQSQALRRDANIALFQERSDELEADLSVGNIDQQQFDKLLLELQQNLLADVDGLTAESASEPSGRVKTSKTSTADSFTQKQGRNSLLIGVLIVVLIPAIAYPLYNEWGFINDVEVMDLFQATVDSGGDAEEARRLIVAIGEYAQEHPDMPWAFYFLAENFASLGMFEEAQISYARAADLLEPNAEKALVLARVATAMYITEGLEITPAVQAVIDEARELNPNEFSLLQLLAADAENNENWSSAISYWRLLIQANPNSEMAQQLRMRIDVAQTLLGTEEGATAGPVIDVRLSIASELELDANLRVFVAVRNASQEGLPPLAAIDTTVAALPTIIRLDNSNAVGPFNLSSADEVYVTGLVSYAGVAAPTSGDYRVQSDAFALTDDGFGLALEISERLP